jgi:mRNA-degrading endonuclease HigB of HigAB toxin-antitoxin module
VPSEIRKVNLTSIKNRVAKHPISDVAVQDWFITAKRSEWKSFNHVKKTFNGEG